MWHDLKEVEYDLGLCIRGWWSFYFLKTVDKKNSLNREKFLKLGPQMSKCVKYVCFSLGEINNQKKSLIKKYHRTLLYVVTAWIKVLK